MLGDTKAYSGFSVDDLEKARHFYGELLGIRTSAEYGLMTLHLAGGRDTLVYPKPDHTPAVYTILNFEVDDIDQAVTGADRAGGAVRALRGPRPGRQGHQPRGRPLHRLVQRPGRQHPGHPAAALTALTPAAH